MVESDKKIYWVVLFSAFLAALFLIFNFSGNFSKEIDDLTGAGGGEPQGDLSEKNQRFWIELDFGGGKKRLFEVAVDKSEYPLAPALITISEFGNFTVELKKDGTITRVDGVSGKWGIYKNGEEVGESAGNLLVKAGERLTIRRQP